MSQVKGKDTKPEMLVRKFLFAQGFRYRLHDKKLPGKPDIVLPKYKTVIFVHGCFWHGHEDCKYAALPQTKTEWWFNKINGNISNDCKAINTLEARGWKVLVIWGCSLKKAKLQETLQDIVFQLRS
ncbi:very short patch repair endonuclease [Niabella hibiscisoli]|nr:very short patch repair endonuclease [Niabella hibiscisoli]MCH5719856.1 very short patch repair endonuclease [Niabella hibiscisoli]